MASLNKACLIGNLGADPEIRDLQSGRIATFSLATSESWTDKASGERKSATEWHQITIFGEGLVSIVEKYLTKGSKVYLEGKIQTRKYEDKNGIVRYNTGIALTGFGSTLVMLGGKDAAAGGTAPAATAPAPANEKSPEEYLDDDIPF